MMNFKQKDNPITCAHCGSNNIESLECDETLEMKGQEISYHGSYFRCSGCGDEFATSESMDANLKAVHKAYEDKKGTL